MLSVARVCRGSLAIALFFVSCLSCYAQNDLSFHRINVDNGLPQNTVMSILQDRTGYIWFSTNDGLCRFDGIEFKIYKYQENNLKSLNGNQITKVFEDHSGNVWVGTFNGLNFYDRERDCFIRCRFGAKESRHNVQGITQDDKGIIWVGTQKGLYSLKANGLKESAIVFTQSQFVKASVHSVLADNNGRLWLGAGQGLIVYDILKKQQVPLNSLAAQMPEVKSQVKEITCDSKKRYWVATESLGVFVINPQTRKWKKYSRTEGLSSNTVRAVAEDSENRIWIGSKQGLNIVDPQTDKISQYFNAPYDVHTLSQNSIRSIVHDREGNVWLGTYSGGVNVVYKNAKKFSVLTERLLSKAGLSNGSVNTILEDNDGSFWVGTDEGGLNHANKNLNSFTYHYPEGNNTQPSLANSIKALAYDGNALWVGAGNGLYKFDKGSKSFTRSTIVDKPESADIIQKYVFLKDSGTLWIGTSFNGLWKVNAGKLIAHYQWDEHDKNKFRSGNITALALTKGKLWVGTQSQGIGCLDLATQKIKNFVHGKPNSISDNGIISLFPAHGGLWIGTRSGLNYLSFSTGVFHQVNNGQQTLSTTIYSIREDTNHALWISSNKGLYSFRFKKSKGGFDPNNFALSNYSFEDGLPSNEFSANSSLLTRSGQLIFGGIRGLVKINPQEVGSNRVVPPVVLTGFEVLSKAKHGDEESPLKGQNVETLKKVVLRYNQNLFSIKYAALNYLNASKNIFAYKLTGFKDDDWHQVGNQRVVTFTNLSPGTYTFQVKAANNDGVWNNTPRTLLIEVLPPWWLSKYAYAVYLLITVGLLYLYNRYTKRTEQAKAQIRFQAESLQKDKELAQQKVNFFLNVSHEIKTPLTMVLAPLERLLNEKGKDRLLNRYLSLMQRNGERLLRMVNQMMDIQKFDEGGMTLQISEGHVESLVRETMRSFEAFADLKNVTLSYSSTHKEISGWFDKEKLETVLYNLLSNAIKFSPFNGVVSVECNVDDSSNERRLFINVSDNGCGIAPEKRSLIFERYYHESSPESNIEGSGLGLEYTKALIDVHAGEITVASQMATAEQSGNTTFTVSISLERSTYPATAVIENQFDASDTPEIIRPENSDFLKLRREAILKAAGTERLQMVVAEDNEELANFIKDTFLPYFDVQTVGNGLRAWQVTQEKLPDILICDVMMPGMTGVELSRQVKTDIRTSHIPLILLTARAALQHKLEGLDTGADDYVTKPFVIELLEARVWNLIASRQQLRLRYQKEIVLEPRHVVITDLDEQFLKKAIAAVEKRLGDPSFTVDELSDAMAMGRATFTRKIKALTNQPPLEFIRDIRLKRASQLLSQGHYNVTEVAYMVGFLDVNYFRKCFKDLFNTTPKAHSVASVTNRS